jgi:hypothetical protein
VERRLQGVEPGRVRLPVTISHRPYLPFVRVTLTFALCALCLIPGSSVYKADGGSQIQLAWDTAELTQGGQWTIYNSTLQGGTLGLPVQCGDVNGDGLDDVVECQLFASAGPIGSREMSGQVNVLLSPGKIDGITNLADNNPNAFSVFGESAGDFLGTEAAIADVNGDGVKDILLGAQGANSGAGAVYVLFGSRELAVRDIDLFHLKSSMIPGVVKISGPSPGARFGVWVSAGDMDGDGIQDVVVGADQLNSQNGLHSGGAFIIFGSRSLAPSVDVSSPPAGVRVTRIIGSAEEQHWGSTVHANDMNRDGVADLVISSAMFRHSADFGGHSGFGAGGPDGSRRNAGEVRVIYSKGEWPAILSLASPPADATRIFGARAFDYCGEELWSADINGDGFNDLIIGALTSAGPFGRPLSGACFVIYGEPALAGNTIDLLSPERSGLHIVSIYGENAVDLMGDTVRAYDINRDGMADLLIGSPTHSSPGRTQAGDMKIVFGQRDFLPPLIDMAAPPDGLSVYRVVGTDGTETGIGGDMSAYSISAGDVDGDGFLDIAVNGMGGDGLGNFREDVGEVYVISGEMLSAKLGVLPPVLAPPPSIISAQLQARGRPVTRALAGETGLTISVSASDMSAEAEVYVNGSLVPSERMADASAVSTRMASLDSSPTVRDTPGILSVQVRNLNPLSKLSASVTAGELAGPTIESFSLKRKGIGFNLNLAGKDYHPAATIEIMNLAGDAIKPKKARIDSDTAATIKIRNTAPAPGTELRIRVVNPNNIPSNELRILTP